MSSATSPTVRARKPGCDSHAHGRPGRACGIRPFVGRMPTTLLNEPGVRRDPPMSDPSPEAWMPAAIAAAAPPEEPAADFDVSYGFTVVPNRGLKVWEPAANSGTFDFPVVTTPAARRREMMS